jgi:hypothetical protein
VPVTGLPFFPQDVRASQNRVYFISSVNTPGPNSKIRIAWIDVPQDPFARSLSATTILATVAQPNIAAAYSAYGDGLVMVVGDAPHAFPTVALSAPLPDLVSLGFFSLAGVDIDSGVFPVSASGTRLVLYRSTGNMPHASFETAAGTAASTNVGDQDLTALAPVGPEYAFAQGGDRSVLYGSLSFLAPVGDAGLTRAVRLTWLVADADAGFDTSKSVEVETYAAPPATVSVGPIAWIDPRNALVTAQSKADPTHSVVRVATNGSPPTLSAQEIVLPNTVDAIGAAASHGLAYILVADSVTQSTIHVVAPGCQ